MADTKTITSPIEESTARVDTANQSGQEELATLAPLTIPDTNMVEVVNVQAGVELPIAFSLDDAQIEIVEADLHLNFANGSTIVLEDFAELSSMENPPSIVMEDGTVLPADAVLFPYLDADSAPAAGPTASSGGIGTYRDDLGQVIEGVGRLGTQDPPSLDSAAGTELDDESLILDEQGPPDAVDDMASTDEESTVVIQVLPNDSDPDGDPLEIVSFTQPTLGTVTENIDGTFTYDPDGQFDGLAVGESATETFTYTISDGQGGSDTATVNVTINGVNDPPDLTTEGDQGVVFEAGLVPDGSGVGPTVITSHGSFTITDPDGLDDIASLALGGTVLTVGTGQDEFASLSDMVGESFVTDNGTVELTSYTDGEFGYLYTLTSETTDIEGDPEIDSFEVVVTDTGMTEATGMINVTVVDDIPSVDIIAAAADGTPTTDSVVEDGAALNGTWTSEYGADTDANNAATVPATIKVTVDGGATTYDLDTAIDTGYGTLSVNSDATWSFDPVPVVQPRDVEFTVTITDADGDVRSDTHTITITDGSDPGDADDVNLTVAEAGLPTPVTDSDTIDFTPGADDLTSMVFSGTVGTISGDYADAAITWTGDGTDTLSGTVTGEPGATIVLTLTGIDLNSGDATVSVTMSDEFKHTTGLDNNTFTIEDIEVVVTDTDLTEATGMINVTVVDDVPIAIDPDPAFLVNNIGETVSTIPLDLDINVDDNYGADQVGNVQFVISDPDSGYTTNSQAIYLYTDGTQLIGSTLIGSDYAAALADSANTGAFIATLNTDGDLAMTDDTYSFELLKQLDGGIGEFNTNTGSWNFEGGNTNYVYYEDLSGSDLPTVLVTPTGVDGEKVNATANRAGASGGGGGQGIGSGEGLRVDFVDNVSGTPISDDYEPEITDPDFNADHTFDKHVLVNGAETSFHLNSGSSTVIVMAFDDVDFGAIDEQDDVGDYNPLEDPDVINKVVLNDVEYTTTSGQVTFETDGSVTLTGIVDADSVVVFTEDGFTTIEYHYDAGSPFSLEGFGASAFDPGALVSVEFDLAVTDADNDSVLVEDAIQILLSPDDHVVEMGTDGNDDLSAATDQATTLVGMGGSDTLVGDSGNDILVGGEGDDVLTGALGADTFIFGGGEGNDSITDFAAEDIIRLTDVLDNHVDGVIDGLDVPITVQDVADGGDLTLHIAGNDGVTNVTLEGYNTGAYDGYGATTLQQMIDDAGFNADFDT